mmetsp:Transcript_8503/g.24392  ORF Transcript_8503/g.24392 Transcript_8503/m.24392 type:complete len:89 (-) Transcript_8503:578-844(-)
MNSYPPDHPIWLDVNFCPDWLYKHVQDPAAAQQQVAQQARLAALAHQSTAFASTSSTSQAQAAKGTSLPRGGMDSALLLAETPSSPSG